MKPQNGKNVLIGISGGIAAYKVPELVRNFVKEGIAVKCVLTQSAQKFVTPLTLQTLSKNKVYTSMFEESEWELDHIELAKWADIYIIVPATAETIAKLASGSAQDLLSCTALAFKKPILVCPAMNTDMWFHPATVANYNRIKEFGYKTIEPQNGELACGVVGVGCLADIKVIFQKALELLK